MEAEPAEPGGNLKKIQELMVSREGLRVRHEAQKIMDNALDDILKDVIDETESLNKEISTKEQRIHDLTKSITYASIAVDSGKVKLKERARILEQFSELATPKLDLGSEQAETELMSQKFLEDMANAPWLPERRAIQAELQQHQEEAEHINEEILEVEKQIATDESLLEDHQKITFKQFCLQLANYLCTNTVFEQQYCKETQMSRKMEELVQTLKRQNNEHFMDQQDDSNGSSNGGNEAGVTTGEPKTRGNDNSMNNSHRSSGHHTEYGDSQPLGEEQNMDVSMEQQNINKEKPREHADGDVEMEEHEEEGQDDGADAVLVKITPKEHIFTSSTPIKTTDRSPFKSAMMTPKIGSMNVEPAPLEGTPMQSRGPSGKGGSQVGTPMTFMQSVQKSPTIFKRPLDPKSGYGDNVPTPHGPKMMQSSQQQLTTNKASGTSGGGGQLGTSTSMFGTGGGGDPFQMTGSMSFLRENANASTQQPGADADYLGNLFGQNPNVGASNDSFNLVFNPPAGGDATGAGAGGDDVLFNFNFDDPASDNNGNGMGDNDFFKFS